MLHQLSKMGATSVAEAAGNRAVSFRTRLEARLELAAALRCRVTMGPELLPHLMPRSAAPVPFTLKEPQLTGFFLKKRQVRAGAPGRRSAVSAVAVGRRPHPVHRVRAVALAPETLTAPAEKRRTVSRSGEFKAIRPASPSAAPRDRTTLRAAPGSCRSR
jgi:hypothetical protein